MTKLDRTTYKYIESEIRHYHHTLKEYKNRRQEILYDRNGAEAVGGGSNLPSSPTERYAIRLVEDRRISRLRTTVDAIETMLESCDKEHKDFVQLYFFAKPQTKTFDGIACELNVSRRTLFRMRDEIVYSVAKLMGEW
ncbi:transcriptional regulator [Sporosarcina sp. Sa2YVA2]|uniref:Transcriptional regulator n=1 Tax=Sporosarcina quadrami TaxID=2762234 RepID=A0ABR8U8R6_9BACL|nr:transcriptional regulator [Sporosarcina quadrami]MBD7984423.1 transcriptional regulator [Sporosarcina quadrami]